MIAELQLDLARMRAAAVTGRALLFFSACLPLGGWLWVLRPTVMVVPGPAERAGGHGNSDRSGSAEMMTYLSK